MLFNIEKLNEIIESNVFENHKNSFLKEVLIVKFFINSEPRHIYRLRETRFDSMNFNLVELETEYLYLADKFYQLMHSLRNNYSNEMKKEIKKKQTILRDEYNKNKDNISYKIKQTYKTEISEFLMTENISRTFISHTTVDFEEAIFVALKEISDGNAVYMYEFDSRIPAICSPGVGVSFVKKNMYNEIHRASKFVVIKSKRLKDTVWVNWEIGVAEQNEEKYVATYYLTTEKKAQDSLLSDMREYR